MSIISYEAKMTIATSFSGDWLRFKVPYFKAVGRIIDLSSTSAHFGNMIDVVAELYQAESSKSLVFSRPSDHLTGRLAQYYYENLQFMSAVFTVFTIDSRVTEQNEALSSPCTSQNVGQGHLARFINEQHVHGIAELLSTPEPRS